MTISYTGDVANASSFGCFNKILLRWRGSVYKLIYKELLAYISLYMLVNLIYRELLVRKSECSDDVDNCRQWKESREVFESLRTYCHEQLSSIPLTFVLGFYVSLIVSRWWRQYSLLPWPDSMAMYTAGFLTGKEERQRLMRRNIIRYVLLSYCMTMRTVSFRVKKRFPEIDHLVDAGLLREDELKVMQELEGRVSANKWFLPLVWATDICARALAEGNVRPQTVKTLVGELVHIRENLTGIVNHDWVSVPLVYTQVVTLAVYSYFAAALIGAQWISPQDNEAYKDAYGLPLGSARAKLDLFYPFFLTIQFAFFFGWLKVAETLINPFGEDDDDFELNRLIDRHIQVGYLIVEQENSPELLQDKYWDECIPKEIPYTVGAEKYKKEEFIGSAEKTLNIKESDKVYADVYNNRRVENRGAYGSKRHEAVYDDHYDLDHYEDIGTPMTTKVSWLGKKMGRLDSVRSNNSMSSSSTYIYGSRLTKKSIYKSQLSLYEKMSRKMNLFEGHKNEGRLRKSSHYKSITNMTRPCAEEDLGIENRSFERDEVRNAPTDELEDENCILDKVLLETISENQDSPYSTQASPNKCRRMSVQSVFGGTTKSESVQKEPYDGPVMELFHEDETTECVPISEKAKAESLAGSKRSRESGVGSLVETDVDLKKDGTVNDENMEGVIKDLKSEVSQDSGISVSVIDPIEIDGEELSASLFPSKLETFFSLPTVAQGSPSPSLPKRKPIISLERIGENTTQQSPSFIENGEEEKNHPNMEDVESPFEIINTVYV